MHLCSGLNYNNIWISERKDESTSCPYSLQITDFSRSFPHAKPAVPALLLRGIPDTLASPEVLAIRADYNLIYEVVNNLKGLRKKSSFCLRMCDIVERMRRVLIAQLETLEEAEKRHKLEKLNQLSSACNIYISREKECYYSIFHSQFVEWFARKLRPYDEFFNNLNIALYDGSIDGKAVDNFAAGALCFSLFVADILTTPAAETLKMIQYPKPSPQVAPRLLDGCILLKERWALEWQALPPRCMFDDIN
jgi:hypothetical protein